MSIKTLRYYEKKELLKPIYINESSGYRYYSRDQFLELDMIKCFRKAGMSIEETKELLFRGESKELIQKKVNKQNEKLEEKIQEILEIKKYINGLNNSILDISKYDIGVVFIRHNKEREILSYKKDIANDEEGECHFREVISDVEYKYKEPYPLLGGKVKYKDVINEKYQYKYIMYFHRKIESKISKLEYKNNMYDKKLLIKSNPIDVEEEILPKGDYITIVFDDSWNNINIYYKKILKYIYDNKMNIIGDFNEVWVMPRNTSSGQSVILGYIEILCKKY